MTSVTNSLKDEVVDPAVCLLTALKTVFGRDVSVTWLDSIIYIDRFTDVLDFVASREYVDVFGSDIFRRIYAKFTEWPPPISMDRVLI